MYKARVTESNRDHSAEEVMQIANSLLARYLTLVLWLCRMPILHPLYAAHVLPHVMHIHSLRLAPQGLAFS